MRENDRKPPLLIRQLSALKRRISKEHPKYEEIKNDLEKRKAGDYGEQSLKYFISLIPETDVKFKVLHDLRLPYKEYYFQIDTLLLFPSFFIILEVKNYTGTLLFDPDHQQLIQIKQNEEKSVPEPILQVKRQYSQFQTWLKQNKISSIPGECLVVLTNNHAIVKTISDPELVKGFVVRSAGLTVKIEKLLRKYTTPIWSQKEWKKIGTLIRKSNVLLDINLLDYYGISVSELLTGVHCPKCERLAMKRLHGRWKCPHCMHVSKDAHVQALEDYSLLIQPSISSREACDFLHISNPNQARRILKAMHLKQGGQTYSTRFILRKRQFSHR